jgi:glycosyltransferase involved in cell wall biosynthesis
MRVLHLTSHLQVGGVARYTVTLAAACAKRGHQVAVAADHGALAAELAPAGVAYWPLPLHTSAEFGLRAARAARQLRERLRQEPVDILHAHTRIAQVIAHRVSRRIGIPYVATWHGFFRPNLGRWLWPCTGDLTIAISEPVQAHLQTVFRVPATRIRLITHGIDPAPFEAPVPADQLHALRAQCGLPAQALVMGTVARLVAAKGVDRLIRALPAVRRRLPQAQVLIVGDGEERGALEALAAAHRVADAVHFAGALPQTRVALALMDAFVFLPADREGFGLSLLEAMAAGRPIVSMRQGGGASWVLDQAGVGIVVPGDDVEALARVLIEVLADPARARHLGAQAQAVLKARYTLDCMVEQVEAAYQALVPARA